LKQIKPDGGIFGIVAAWNTSENLVERSQGVRDGLADIDWKEVINSPKNGMEDTVVSLEKMWELVEENPGIGAVVSVVGLVRIEIH
jgi:ABC-type sugar transport system substrate-binding protein